MGKKAPAAPPPPDYAAAATAQGKANVDAANQGAVLSNPNIISPYGNQTVTWAQNPNAPGGGYQPTVTQTLTPTAQAALDAQQQVQLAQSNLANQGINKAQGLLSQGFQYNGPGIRTSMYGPHGGAPQTYAAAPGGQPNMGGATPGGGAPTATKNPLDVGFAQDMQARAATEGFHGFDGLAAPANNQGFPMGGPPLNAQGFPDKAAYIASRGGGGGGGLASANINGPTGAGPQGGQEGPGPVDFGPRAGDYGLAGGINAADYGQAKSQADLSNVAAMPINAGTTAQQAILQRLNPQIEQDQKATQQRLANQGIPVGSEAWQNEMRQQGNQQNDLRSQAALQGLNLDMAANEQGFNQAQQNAGLYNSALAQNFGQGLQGQQLNNSAIGQNFGQGATAAGLYNQAQNQQFNQGLQQFNAENAAQQADWAQQLAQYNQPLNQVTALMSGSQIQNPQFQAYSGQNVQAAPVFQGVQAQDQSAQNTYAQQVAKYNAGMGALGQIGGTAAMLAFSDFRLKSNIERVGDHPLGIGVYEYDIDGHRERGVMAHEVALVKPEAVHVHPDGFLMVDYDRLAA